MNLLSLFSIYNQYIHRYTASILHNSHFVPRYTHSKGLYTLLLTYSQLYAIQSCVYTTILLSLAIRTTFLVLRPPYNVRRTEKSICELTATELKIALRIG